MDQKHPMDVRWQPLIGVLKTRTSFGTKLRKTISSQTHFVLRLKAQYKR
jgi:hypothetical protein